MAGANRAPIRVGNGAGFWGDNQDAPFLLARDGRLDVLTLEYLAELTLAILAHLRSKDPRAGYVTDFPELIERLAPMIGEPDGLRIVTNAGGLNPEACAARCGAILERAGRGGLPLAVVTGDDILGRIPQWVREGVDLAHMETGEPITTVADRLVCANAYLGAMPIADALTGGGRVVITGRVADASLTLGPACADFGWAWDDWPRLAGASVAGHLIECGAQATGGLWHHWDQVPDLAGVGYPIAELHADGSSVITKTEGTGGLVSVANVAEQLVYEIDDPARYRTPDVDVDLTTVALTQEGADRVAVREANGQAPGDRLKVAAVYRDGWTASGMVAVVGRGASEKARAAGRIVLERVRRAGFELAEALVECLGEGDVVPVPALRPADPSREVVLRVTVRDPRREAVERFCRELAPLVTAGPPGIAGYATGRPSPRPAFAYWPTLVPRSMILAAVDIQTASEWASEAGGPTTRSQFSLSTTPPHPDPPPQGGREFSASDREFLPPSPLVGEGRGGGMTEEAQTGTGGPGLEPLENGPPDPVAVPAELDGRVRLGDLAHARSGDKGDRANIGVVADDEARYAWLDAHLTEAVVTDFLRPLGIGRVRRYALPRIHAWNFVIEHALGGGASRSLRLDTQGKALGVALMELRLPSSGGTPHV